MSTAEQVEGTSLASQRAACDSYCSARGWVVHDVLVDDGVSGATRSRPALDRLRLSIDDGTTDVVVVAKLDRLGRTVRGLVEWMSEWDDKGVALVSVSESFDSTSPAARMQRNLLAMFAEFERDRIAERTAEGRDATVAVGGWPGGPAPFGWRLVRTPADRITRLELDANESATILRAVDLFVRQRKGTAEIFQVLNAESRPSRGGPGRTERTIWSASKVRHLLLVSDHWAGTWTYRNPSAARHRDGKSRPIALSIPPILSKRQLNRLRARLAETSVPVPDQVGRERHLLSRRLVSPHGSKMYGNRRKYRHTAHYMCPHTLKATAWPRCSCRNIAVELLDDAVWTAVTEQIARVVPVGVAGDDELERAIRLATGVRDAMVQGSPGLRRRIIELLDVRVRVTGWQRCHTCNGKGWLPDPRALPKVKLRPQGEHMRGVRCPTCLVYKYLPDIEVVGRLPPLPDRPSTIDRGAGFRLHAWVSGD